MFFGMRFALGCYSVTFIQTLEMTSAMRKQFLLLSGLSLFTLYNAGCGGNVVPGVADAPDEPALVLTPEEENTEMESAANAAGEQ